MEMMPQEQFERRKLADSRAFYREAERRLYPKADVRSGFW
jgi:hypothetical protein